MPGCFTERSRRIDLTTAVYCRYIHTPPLPFPPFPFGPPRSQNKITGFCLLSSAPEGLPVQATWDIIVSWWSPYGRVLPDLIFYTTPLFLKRRRCGAGGSERTVIPLPKFGRSSRRFLLIEKAGGGGGGDDCLYGRTFLELISSSLTTKPQGPSRNPTLLKGPCRQKIYKVVPGIRMAGGARRVIRKREIAMKA